MRKESTFAKALTDPVLYRETVNACSMCNWQFSGPYQHCTCPTAVKTRRLLRWFVLG